MSEQAAEQGQVTPTPPPATDPAPTTDSATPAADSGNEVESLKAQVKTEQEKRQAAEKLAQARDRELNKVKQGAMSDAEKTIADAEERGRTTAAIDYGKKLARSRFDAEAGRRNADFDTSEALEYVDLAKLVDDKGDPDETAIKAAVERLVPVSKPDNSPAPRPDRTQGGGGAMPLNGDPIEKSLKEKLGIR